MEPDPVIACLIAPNDLDRPLQLTTNTGADLADHLKQPVPAFYRVLADFVGQRSVDCDNPGSWVMGHGSRRAAGCLPVRASIGISYALGFGWPAEVESGTFWMIGSSSWFWRTAAHVKNVPGHKTDVNDAMWLAELLIRSSFVPDMQTQEMRSLLRTRKQLIREQSSHPLRVQKTLEDANIKLDSVLSDLMGQSGRAMTEALIAGGTNPAKLASLTRPFVVG
jgi:Transposase